MEYIHIPTSMPNVTSKHDYLGSNEGYMLILKMYEINTLLFLPLKTYLIILKHIKSLIFIKETRFYKQL